VVIEGSVSVLANGEESPTFKTGKGLRQGDPLSPLLFNLVVDALTKMLTRPADRGLVVGLLERFTPGGILALQYSDDTLIFYSSYANSLRNLKCIPMLFERVSGMKINFHKSEFVPLIIEDEKAHDKAHLLGCPVGAFPVKYLGVTLHFEKLGREDLQPLVDKLIKRAAGWRGKLLAYSSRLVLIKTCLASVPFYLMSFINFLNGPSD
jgi:hypothetical protein